MKSFIMCKLPLVLLGLGAALVLAPACKAQSEVSPDHFDGSDTWEVAAARSARTTKPQPQSGALQARNTKPASQSTLQMAVARDLSKPTPQEAVAIQDKRKTTPKPQNKQ